MRRVAMVAFGLVLAFAAAEAFVRAMGNRPWTSGSTTIEGAYSTFQSLLLLERVLAAGLVGER